MISAEVICDSISSQGKRLTTFKLRYPKFIHGEFMTHRVISRNASSSRAIPTSKLLEEVKDMAKMAMPVFWGKNQPGMQAAEELDNGIDGLSKLRGPSGGWGQAPRTWARTVWMSAADQAAHHAEELIKIGAHKQIVNRLLEPFSHINVVATATEWDNFFGLRLHKDAQPEMRALAEAMWASRSGSMPNNLEVGCWHLPFIDNETWSDIFSYTLDDTVDQMTNQEAHFNMCCKVSVARCARVSYESFETGKRSTIEEDLALCERLLGAQPLHASPAEHQATPDEPLMTFPDGPKAYAVGINRSIGFVHPEQHGNFIGWRQYRKMIPNEAVAPLPEGYST